MREVSRGLHLRILRWFLAALVVLLGLTGWVMGALEEPRLLGGIVLALLLAGVNVVAQTFARRDRAPSPRLVRGGIALDMACAVAAVLLYAAEPGLPVWSLLMFPVLGALWYAGTSAALSVWAGAVLVLVLAALPEVALLSSSRLDAVAVQLVVVLVLGGIAAWAITDMEGMVLALEASRQESAGRGRSLEAAATSSAAIARSDGPRALERAVEGVHALGFDVVEVVSRSGQPPAWRSLRQSGLSEGVVLGEALASSTAGHEATTVRDSRDPVVAAAGLHSLVVVRVDGGEDPGALLVAGCRGAGGVRDDRARAAALIAGQLGAALVVADARERSRRLGQRLAEHGWIDPLTGLGNRARLHRDLEVAAGGTSVLLRIALDDFHRLLDIHGRQTIDEMLRVVGQRLMRCLRPEDTLARHEDDEYAALLNAVSDPRDAVAIARRMLEALEAPVSVAGRRLSVTVSIGVGYDSSGLADAAVLLEDAAQARDLARGDVHTSIRLDRRLEQRLAGDPLS